MRLILITTGFVFCSIFSFAQDNVMALSGPKGPVIEHKVSAGETFYGISRKYNTKVPQLLEVNGFDVNKILAIGEVIKIPLVTENFNQKEKMGTPVYYAVADGEGLYSVSVKFNKISIKTIKDWNGLKSDVAPKDKPLIVGYLMATGVNSVAVTPVVKEAKKNTATKTVVAEEKTPVKQKTPEAVIEEKIITKQEVEQAIKIEPEIDETGYFKPIFEKTTNPSLLSNRTLMSGIFKTASGLKDKKYYMLIDGVAVGTIVKVSNPQNGKIVYAKVLGNMKDVKYSEDLNMRISEAAADVLQIQGYEQFVVNVNY